MKGSAMTEEQRRPNRRFRLIAGALAVAAVVSGGAAYAASQDDSPQARSQAIVTDAAGTLGVDPSKLSDALKKALENQVDAQVTAGKLSAAQGDAIKKRIEDGTQPIFGGGAPRFGGAGGAPFGHRGPGGMGKRGFGGPGFGFGLGAGLDELSTFLDLTPADLRTQLASGKSLADIAKAQGKTVADLEAAITTAVTKRLDAAVAAKKLTADQEQRMLAGLAKHLDDFVNAAPKEHAFGFGGHRGWGHHDKGENGSAPAAPAPPAAPAGWSPAPEAA
jgi:hypothetical protein